MRNSRSMPQWAVQEPNGRVGPKPPALPIPGHDGAPRIPLKKPLPEPDYEVIDFTAQQQYTNAQPLKLPPAGSKPPVKCELCGSLQPKYRCEQCKNQLLCTSCDDMYHRHPKRKSHIRKVVELHVATNIRPPLPPKGEHAAPVAPPRRKQKINLACPGAQTVPAVRLEPPPSPSLSLRERMSTLKRMIVPGNRGSHTDDQPASRSAAPPLPSRPPTRPTTPLGGNPFDAIQKPPSITMEKIKQQQSATLDRMSMLQQRYRQSQLNLHAASTAGVPLDRPIGNGCGGLASGVDPKRRVSSASQVDLRPMNGRRSSYTTNTDFTSASSDQWSNHSSTLGPRMRAGSMATGMNTASNHMQRPLMQPMTPQMNARRSPGLSSDGSRTTMSHSVFDLNQHQHQHPGNQNGFGASPMFGPVAGVPHQQTQQSGGNCMSCSQQQLNWNVAASPPTHQYPGSTWDMNAHHLNGSNMSLNLMPSAYYPQRPMPSQQPPPPAWFNGHGWTAPPQGMYPYPMGMMPGHPADFHDRRSRGPSRSQSRAASPSMSMKSRKSMLSSRQQPHRTNSFAGPPHTPHHRLTNDEADTFSDEDYVEDFRSFSGGGGGSRRNSSISAVLMRRGNRHQDSTASSNDPDENSATEAAAAAAAAVVKQRSPPHRRLSYRERRSGSVRSGGKPAAKVCTSTSTTTGTVESTLLVSPDSGSESGTRALVQAKIREKIAVQSSVDESSSEMWKRPAAAAPVPAKSVSNGQRKPAAAATPIKPQIARKVSDPIEPEILRIISDGEQRRSEQQLLEQVASIADAVAVVADDSGPVGPPPTTPDFEWECEFCTFVNEPNTKICIVCCKTPVTAATRKSAAGMAAAPEASPSQTTAAEPVRLSAGDKEASPSSSERAKGKARKISFWPGTKAK